MKQIIFSFLFCVACSEAEAAQRSEPEPIVDAGPSPSEKATDLQSKIRKMTADMKRHNAESKEVVERLQAIIDNLEAKPNPLAISATLAASIPRKVRRRGRDNTWKRTRAQAVQLARMFVSEDSSAIRRISGGGTEGVLTSDHRMMMQTIYAHRSSRKSFKGWIDVMAFLSPHVGRLKEPKPDTRVRWTSRLAELGGAPPETWIDCDKNKPCDGDWRVHGPLWEKLREATVEAWTIVDFQHVEKVIKMKPFKWGNADDVIRTLGKYPNNWCALNIDTKNFFLARPGEGCQLNDPATIAARTGQKVKRGP